MIAIGIAGLVIGVAALAIAYGAWWQPQWKAKADHEPADTIDHRVEAELKDHHFDEMATDVKTMKGQLQEVSGFLKLLAEKELRTQATLSKPQFDRQVQILGTTVSVARLVHAPAAPKVVNEISLKLAHSEPTQPEHWKAAGEVISHRSELQSNFVTNQLPNCFSIQPSYIFNSVPNQLSVTFPLSGCYLAIDDLEGFRGSVLEAAIRRSVLGAAPSSIHYIFDLTHVYVIYRGGQLIPVSTFVLHECSFEFDTPQTIPSPAKVLTRTLLATECSEIKVQMPVS